jgi:sulfur-oxidizing protein SoxX
VLCHRVASLPVTFQGDLGPDLSSVGARLTPAQLRLRIVDASLLNPRTIMPPYYRTWGLSQVAIEYRNKPVLTALQVEQLVSYLASLQE